MVDERQPASSPAPHRVLIVGAGDTGLELARRLPQDWDITMVDINLEQAHRCTTAGGFQRPVRLHQGDASSRLVLQGVDASAMDIAIVTTAPDEVSLEVCRLLKDEFHLHNVWALVRRARKEAAFQALGIDIVSDFESSAALLSSRVTGGYRVASDVGLGRGEIMETEVLPNSSVIDKPLKQLQPKQWLVSLVYRDDEIIVPHGDTTLQEGDRVLLTGEPRLLPSIARFIRSGHSEFPLHYGTDIVAPLGKYTNHHLDELTYFMKNTRAEAVEFVSCDPDSPHKEVVEKFARDSDFQVRVTFEESNAPDDLRCWEKGRSAGVLLQPPETISIWARLGLVQAPLLKRLGSIDTPVLIPKGTFPYQQLLFAIHDSVFPLEAAILAIDVARILSAELTVAVAIPPEIVAGRQMFNKLKGVLSEMRELAGAYGTRIKTIELHGNPIGSLLEQSRNHNLLIYGLRKNKKRSLTRPGVEPSLLHRANCSMLVLPY